jgi:hypothetical protein
MAVNFHPSNFHVAAAAIIWFALSSFIEVLPWRHRCTVSVKTLEVVFTKRHGSSDSKPNKPDERNGRQFRVSEADVSNVRAAQYAIFSASIKLDVLEDSGVADNIGCLTRGETFEPLNWRFLCLALRV